MKDPTEGLLRVRKPHEHARVTNIELFFDLVFVFAVTQLSHSFLADLTLRGAGHMLLLFLPVWWVWIYTSWVTNWLDPERNAVRLLLLALMLAGLVLAASIPEAFGGRGWAFAAAYFCSQVGRSLFMLWALGGASPANTRNFQRITWWLAAIGTIWLLGAFLDGPARLLAWIIAVAIEYSGPSLGFWVPGLGRSSTADWDVEGGHLAERCSLFIIIALGESILVTGATFAQLDWDGTGLAAFAVAFLGSLAMWWIYFDTGAERGSRVIEASSDPGRLARLAYTYLHLPIVGGIIVAAVANDLVLTQPVGCPPPLAAAVILGGPLLYLMGNTLFKWTISGRCPLSHLVGFALFVPAAVFAVRISALGLGGATTLILIVVAIWETISLRYRGTPAPVG